MATGRALELITTNDPLCNRIFALTRGALAKVTAKAHGRPGTQRDVTQTFFFRLSATTPPFLSC